MCWVGTNKIHRFIPSCRVKYVCRVVAQGMFSLQHRYPGRVFVGKSGHNSVCKKNLKKDVCWFDNSNPQNQERKHFTKMKVSLFSVVLGPSLCWRRGPTHTDLELWRHIPFFYFFQFFRSRTQTCRQSPKKNSKKQLLKRV